MDDFEDKRVRRLRQARTVADLVDQDPAEFSVFWWDPEGNRNCEGHSLTAGQAVVLARRMTDRPAARIGVFARIIIVDGADNTVFEWRFREGVTYPNAGDAR